MATLETLELRISSNADKASGGIDSLVGSLSRLGDAVSKSLGSLNSLAQSLSSIAQSAQSLGSKTMSKLFGGTGSASDLAKVKAQTNAIKDQFDAAQKWADKAKSMSSAQREWVTANQLMASQRESASNTQRSSPQELMSQIKAMQAANWEWNMQQRNSHIGRRAQDLIDQSGNLKQTITDTSQAMEGITNASESMSNMKETLNSLGATDASHALSNVSESLSEVKGTLPGTTSELENVDKELKSKKTDAAQAAKGVNGFGEAVQENSENIREFGSKIGEYRQGISNLFSGISSFMGRVASIATRMLIRKAIKLVVAAAKEGTDNMYQYSKSMGTSFASSMDSMSSSLAQLKNAAGTAIAPALSAIIPVLNSIASAAITAFNALSQLFALLSGSTTWTRATAQATEYAEAVDEATGGGGGGSNEGLAEFDQLDLIASESGGGGGGGSGGIDYASMFEEVGEFSEEIKALVSWIEDHMDSILGLAIAIGTAILAWKVSEAFSGLLSQLAGLLAAVAVFTITMQLVWLFDQEYLKTGDIGWLVADLLTTALGATIAGVIVGQILGGAWGYYAAGFTFMVSALTSIIALLGATDVSALSEKSILLAIDAGLKAGAGLALIAYGAGYNLVTAASIGASGALFTFGAVIAVKSALQAIQGETGPEEVEGIVLGSLSMGIGATLYAKLVAGADLAGASIFGFSFAAAAAVTILGAVIGIKAAARAVAGEDTETTIIEAAKSSALLGAGAILWKKMFIGGSWTGSALTGAAFAIATFSAIIGIQAAARYIASDDTQESLTQLAISSLSFGVFGSATALALGAGSLAIPLGLIAALAAVAIEIGIKASASVAEWGTVNLTAEEVQTFVNTKMFSINVNALVSKINATLDETANVSEDLGSQLITLVGDMNILTLGVDTTKTISSIKDTVLGKTEDGSDGLIAKALNLTEAKVSEMKIVFGTVKAYDGEGNDITAEALIKGIEGWDKVNETMTALGEELSKYLTKGATGELDDFEQEYVTELLEKVSAISQAITNSTIAAEAMTKMEFTLKDLTKDSADKVIEEFNSTRETLRTTIEQGLQAEINSYNQLAAVYAATGNEELAEFYRDMAAKLVEGFDESVEKNLETYTSDVKQMIIDWITNQFGDGGVGEGVIGADAWTLLLEKEGLTGEKLKEAIHQQIYNLGASKEQIQLMEIIGFSGWDVLSKDLQQGLIEYLGITPQTMATLKDGLSLSAQDIVEIYDWEKLEEDQKQNLISSLVNGMGSSETFSYLKDQFTFTAEDIISFSNWDSFSMKEKLNFLTALATAFGNSEALAAAENAGIKIGELVKQGMESTDPDVQAAAKKFAQLVQDEVEGINPTIDATANISVEVDTKINVSTNNGEIKSATTTDIRAAAGTNNRPTITPYATGAYNIPRGDVFIANEAGAELVGQINGRTSVANQQQIIEGIQRGVAEANNEQNALLRRQNELLTAILQKDQSVRIGASTALGRTVRESLDLYEIAAGGR